MKRFLFLMVAVVIFTGCAHSGYKFSDSEIFNPTISVKEVNFAGMENKEKVDLFLEPYETVGVLETQAIKEGKCSFYPAFLSPILLGEFEPGRIRWNGITIDNEGMAYFTQLLFNFSEFYRRKDAIHIRALVVVDYYPKSDSWTMIFSSDCNYVYDLFGKEFPVNVTKLKEDKKYLVDFVRKNGTRIGDLKGLNFTSDFFDSLSNKWGIARGEHILTPYSKEELKALASKNKSYTPLLKFVSEARMSVSPNPYSTAFSWIMDFKRASEKLSTGWDYSSVFQTRREMGLVLNRILSHETMKYEKGGEK